MDEFGQYPAPPPIPEDQEKKNEVVPTERRTSLRPRQSVRATRPPSPPPFSDYTQPSAVVDVQPEAAKEREVIPLQMEEPEGDAGCCKCIIM